VEQEEVEEWMTEMEKGRGNWRRGGGGNGKEGNANMKGV